MTCDCKNPTSKSAFTIAIKNTFFKVTQRERWHEMLRKRANLARISRSTGKIGYIFIAGFADPDPSLFYVIEIESNANLIRYTVLIALDNGIKSLPTCPQVGSHFNPCPSSCHDNASDGWGIPALTIISHSLTSVRSNRWPLISKKSEGFTATTYLTKYVESQHWNFAIRFITANTISKCRLCSEASRGRG